MLATVAACSPLPQTVAGRASEPGWSRSTCHMARPCQPQDELRTGTQRQVDAAARGHDGGGRDTRRRVGHQSLRRRNGSPMLSTRQFAPCMQSCRFPSVPISGTSPMGKRPTNCSTRARPATTPNQRAAAALPRQIDSAAVASDRPPELAVSAQPRPGEKLGDWAEAHAMFFGLFARPRATGRRRCCGARPPRPPGLRETTLRRRATPTRWQRFRRKHGSGARSRRARAQTMHRVPGLAAADAAAAIDAALPAFAAQEWEAPGFAVRRCRRRMRQQHRLRPDRAPGAGSATGASPRDGGCGATGRAPVAARRHLGAARTCRLPARALWPTPSARRPRREHALRALAMIDANVTDHAENVDCAFLLLEQSRPAGPSARATRPAPRRCRRRAGGAVRRPGLGTTGTPGRRAVLNPG